jgi:diguanylate cyclase (GGDEF)-like protein
LRTVDLLGRYGGEELMVVLPETAVEPAAIALERIRSSVASLRITASGDPVRLTVSGGLVQVRSGEPLEAALKRADLALYEAKRAGRDRVLSG